MKPEGCTVYCPYCSFRLTSVGTDDVCATSDAVQRHISKVHRPSGFWRAVLCLLSGRWGWGER